MSEYIPFSQEERDRAHHTNLVALLRSQGEVPQAPGTEYEWRIGGQKVTIRGHLWYHQYEQIGGDAVGFVCRFYDKSYPDAVQFLLSQEHCGQLLIPPTPEKSSSFQTLTRPCRERWPICKTAEVLTGRCCPPLCAEG